MSSTEDRIRVWDPLVRISHWLLLGLFILSYLTGEEESDLHFYSGYVILAIIVLRIVWGFVGSEHARFRSFLTSPLQAFRYILGLVRGDAPRYIGHNPAAALMMLTLLIFVLATAGSGLVLHGYHGEGPLAFLRPESVATVAAGIERDGDALVNRREHHEEAEEEHERGERFGGEGATAFASDSTVRSARPRLSPELRQKFRFWKETHEIFVNLTILLVILHVGGVIASSLRHRENLVKSMIDGYKERERGITAE